MSLKKNNKVVDFFLSILICLFMFFLIIFSNTNIEAAKSGLSLWATTVVPSLFPFLFLTEVLNKTKLVSFIGKKLNRIIKKIFNVPGEGAFAFLMGLISGYPVGAKIVTNFRNKGICTQDEGNRMLAFTNNAGPLFIIGTVGVGFFGNKTIGFLLFFTHLLACITVGIILKFFSKDDSKDINLVSNDEDGANTSDAISTILMIGGYIVIFSVLLSILDRLHILNFLSILITPILSIFNIDSSFSVPFLSGILELTNGINLVSNIAVKSISLNMILSAFLLGFGGLSVSMQVYNIISKSDLSIKKYIIGKLMQGLIAGFYTFLAIKFIPIFNFDIAETFAPISTAISYPICFFGINNYFILFAVLCIIVYFIFAIPSKSRIND